MVTKLNKGQISASGLRASTWGKMAGISAYNNSYNILPNVVGGVIESNSENNTGDGYYGGSSIGPLRK